MAKKEIVPEELTRSVFDLIGKDWTLITAGKEGKVNAMTASWGGMGVLWGRDVVFIFVRQFVRQSRYTKEFLDASDTFSLNFLDPKAYRPVQNYFGTVSGRDEDKFAESGLHTKEECDTPFIEESNTVLLCRKAGVFAMPESGMAPGIPERWYADHNDHTMYVGFIEKVLKED